MKRREVYGEQTVYGKHICLHTRLRAPRPTRANALPDPKNRAGAR